VIARLSEGLNDVKAQPHVAQVDKDVMKRMLSGQEASCERILTGWNGFNGFSGRVFNEKASMPVAVSRWQTNVNVVVGVGYSVGHRGAESTTRQHIQQTDMVQE
jgi:hypothetical protein